MEQSSLVKVVAAFVAGMVVALGSALIYVRVSDGTRTQPSVQSTVVPTQSTPTELPEAGQDTSNQASDTSDQAGKAPPQVNDTHPSKTEPVSVPRARKATFAERRREIPKPVAHHEQPTKAHVEVAQNIPPPAPVSDPAPQIREPDPPAPQTPPEQQPESAPAPVPPVRQPHVVTLQNGLPLAIRLGETLSTDHNYTGDTFRASLESPIVMDGFIIADKGSKVLGRIVNAQRAGRIGGVADMTLALTEINTTDGQRVRIQSTTYDKRGPSSGNEDAAKIAGGAALGAIIGAVAGGGKGAAIGAGVGGAAGTGAVIATRGKPAVFSAEMRLTFRLSMPVTITEKLNY